MVINFRKGFSVVELIVSVAIMSVILSTVLWNYSTANDNLVVSSASQEVAVAIRQAQVYALSVRESGVGSGIFTYAYGVYFDPTNSPSDFYIFVDKGPNANSLFDIGSGCGSGSTECIEKISLRNGVRFTAICDATNCPPTATAKKLNITFIRPNPDARVYFTDNSAAVVAGPSSRGKVTLSSPKGKTINVTVESTGQVLVQ